MLGSPCQDRGRKYVEKIEEGKVDDDCVAQRRPQIKQIDFVIPGLVDTCSRATSKILNQILHSELCRQKGSLLEVQLSQNGTSNSPCGVGAGDGQDQQVGLEQGSFAAMVLAGAT